MDFCDVLIVGGGPAGSSCAWALRHAALDVAVLDKETFPRHKVCGGWITPPVLEELDIDPVQYARGRVLQSITRFRTGSIGSRALESDYGLPTYRAPVSYGIRRCEFDDFLLRRSGARLLLGSTLTRLERSGDRWIVNGHIKAKMLVGAGGHFCPVAKMSGARRPGEHAVVAQEAEFEMDSEQAARCKVEPERPELYFCSDMKGYGWCFRKQNYLNIGLGRMDRHRLSEHVAAFVRFLRGSGRIAFDIPAPMLGHAYLLYGKETRNVVADQLLLIGDSAGLAYAQSGEGIRPAVESGLLAGEAIRSLAGNWARESLSMYSRRLAERFGNSGEHWTSALGQRLPAGLIAAVGRSLLGTRWFTRRILIDHWFLHRGQPALSVGGMVSEMQISEA